MEDKRTVGDLNVEWTEGEEKMGEGEVEKRESFVAVGKFEGDWRREEESELRKRLLDFDEGY